MGGSDRTAIPHDISEEVEDVRALMDHLAIPQFDYEHLRDVIATIAHVAAAQINWLERWQTGSNQRSTTVLQESMRTVDTLRESFERSHSDLRQYIADLTDADLERPLAYKDSIGVTFERVLWQLITARRQRVATLPASRATS